MTNRRLLIGQDSPGGASGVLSLIYSALKSGDKFSASDWSGLKITYGCHTEVIFADHGARMEGNRPRTSTSRHTM